MIFPSKSNPSKSKGFTLVELLVVMTITMVAIGLVGGLAVDGYTKFQAKSELMKLERLVVQANTQSFAVERVLRLAINGQEAELTIDDRRLFFKTFEFIRFPNEVITFNKMGFPNKNSITVDVLGKAKRISLENRDINANSF